MSAANGSGASDPALPGASIASCENEPIHIPGAIQPHGFLLALEEPQLVVRVASANLLPQLGRPMEDVLGKRLDAVLSQPEVDLVRTALGGAPEVLEQQTLSVGTSACHARV